MMWKTLRLSELFNVGSSKRVLKSEWKESGVPFYRGREVTQLSKKTHVDNHLFITESHYQSLADRYGVPSNGDIMITAIGTIGNTHIVRKEDRFYFKDGSVLWLKKTTDVLSEYINYWLKSESFKLQLDSGNGATVDTLTIKKLSSVMLSIPPLAEQQRIVAKLDAAFAEIDKAVEVVEAKEVEVEKLKNSLLASELTRKSAYSATDWKVDDLGNLIAKGETVNPTLKPLDTFRYIDVSAVSNKSFSITGTQTLLGKDAPSRARRAVREGDVLFATVRPALKRIAVVPIDLHEEVCSTGYIVLRPKKDFIISSYIFYVMMSPKVMNLVEELQTGASYPAVTDTQVKSLVIEYPSIKEQQRIVAKLDTAFAEAAVAKHAVQLAKSNYAALKSAILAKELQSEAA